MEEYFDLYLPDGTKTGEVISESQPIPPDRATMLVHVFIFDRTGFVLLQKRSMRKDTAPGRWDTSVGGHVDFGESLQDAVVREAREELGLHIDPEECRFLFQYVWQSSRERELVTAFALTSEVTPQPDHDEVDEGRYFTLSELQSLLGTQFFTSQFEQQELPHLLQVLEK